MTQSPVLTQAQCAGSNDNYTVLVVWNLIQGQSYFVATVFDPQNTEIAHMVVDGSTGLTSARMTSVALNATTNYTVRVAQSDQAGTPVSAYSGGLNLQQNPLTDIKTVNNMKSIELSATFPTTGATTGLDVSLFLAPSTNIKSAYIAGSSGVLQLDQPLDPSLSYIVYLAPTSNSGLSSGASQNTTLEMGEASISLITYDGDHMLVATPSALPAGTIISGTLFANGVSILEQVGAATAVTFDLDITTLDMSKLYSATLRAVVGGNSGPQSLPSVAVVAPPAVKFASYIDNHVSAEWVPAPVLPTPTGGSVAALADGNLVGHPVINLGYQGSVDISGTVPASSLSVQVNSIFGVAHGPPTTTVLAFTKPEITSVETTPNGINVLWTDAAAAHGYRVALSDSTGKPISYIDTSDLSAALAFPANPAASNTITVQPVNNAGGIDVLGPISDPVDLLVQTPAVTATSFDGTKVTVHWEAPTQNSGITGFEIVLLDATTRVPTGDKATKGAADTSADITVTLTEETRLVAAVRATGVKTSGSLGAVMDIITIKPVITAVDINANFINIAWHAPETPGVNSYRVNISDNKAQPNTISYQTMGTSLEVENTLTSEQVYVWVVANGPASSGPNGASVNLFGSQPSFYPQPASGTDPSLYLVRSATNQPAATDIVLAFPDVFSTAPTTLPSSGIFSLEANAGSTLLPYKLTIPATSVAWSFDAASRATLATDFYAFLKKMEMPDGTIVQIKPGALAMVRQAIALALPLLYSETLHFMYGFDPNVQSRGFVDLIPGMRMRLDTQAYQISPPNNQQIGYVPTGMATYEIQSYVGNQSLDTGFNAFLSSLKGLDVRSALAQQNGGGGGVIDLYNSAGRQPYFRLLYPAMIQNSTYSGYLDASNSPVILGAANYNTLDAATEQYTAQGNFSGLTDIYPFFFRGRTMPSPEILVTINGQQRWMTLGSTVENLITSQGSQPYCVSGGVGGFVMKRSIGSLTSDLTATKVVTNALVSNRVRLEYADMNFSPLQPGNFGLPLLSGDIIHTDPNGSM